MNLSQVLNFGRERFPDAVAIHHDSHHLTYERARRDAESIAWNLHRQGVGPGQIVGTDIPHPITHWLVLVALMRIGAVSVTFTAKFEDEVAALPGLSAIISSGQETRTHPNGVRRIPVESDWLQAPHGFEAGLPSPSVSGEALGRICFTSGTAGTPKAIKLDSSLLAARLTGTAQRTRIHARSVLWCGLGPDTAYGFTATIAAWLEGASVVFSRGGSGAYRYLAAEHVNLLVSSPAALDALLRDAASGSLQRLSATAIVAGGRLPVRLRDELLERVCTQVLIAYGSSETGGVTLGQAAELDFHPGRVGTVYPGAEVRIVGEDDGPLAVGTPGRMLVRTDSSVTGYTGDPEATATHFSHGWFETGDTAVMSEDGALTILGRAPDLLNLGGVKISAAEIDAIAREHGDIDDACAVLLSPGDRDQQLAVIVAGRLVGGDDLAARIRAAFPAVPRFRIYTVPSIPRGSMGKVDRRAVAELVRHAIAVPADGAARVRLVGTF